MISHGIWKGMYRGWFLAALLEVRFMDINTQGFSKVNSCFDFSYNEH